MDKFDQLLRQTGQIVQLLQQFLPPPAPIIDWEKTFAARWRSTSPGQGALHPLPNTQPLPLEALQNVPTQRTKLIQNTAQFVAGKPANNVLLTGARGTGKSSLVKALLPAFAAQGLRLLEVDKADLHALPDILAKVSHLPFRFIVFCDDLSFEADENSYKALKSLLDGSLSAQQPAQILLYATSNRRHLLPEFMHENLHSSTQGEEIHPQDSIEEKLSLSERFGLWLTFYPFNQEEYLAVVWQSLATLGCHQAINQVETQAAALRWALTRGMRSGRVAWQFALDWAGQHG